MPFDYNSHTLLADSQNDRPEFPTVAIEQHHFIALLESQNARGVMCNCSPARTMPPALAAAQK